MFIPKWVIALIVIWQMLRPLLRPDGWLQDMYASSPWVKTVNWLIFMAVTAWLVHWAM